MARFDRTWNWVDQGQTTLSASTPIAQAFPVVASPPIGNPLAWSWTDGVGNEAIALLQPPGDGPQEQTSGGDTIPNDIGTPFTLALGATATGVVNTPGDADWYRVELVAGQHYTFTLTGSSGAPLEDPYLQLFGSLGNQLHFDDDGGAGLSSLLRFTPATSGTYYINARAWHPETGPTLTGGYTLTFSAGTAQNPLTYIDLPYQFPGSTIAVWFAQQGENNSGDAAIRNWTQAEMNSVWSVLNSISAVANITFTAAASNANANFVLSIADLGANVLGHFFVGVGGGAFDPDGSGWNSNGMAAGSLGYATITHEILHGLGLGHPHYDPGDDIFMQGVLAPFSSFGTYQMNQGVFTTLSYNDGWSTAPMGNGNSVVFGSQGGPMALDIALLQQIYGQNPNTNSGNNTYTIATTNGAYLSVWDTGGADIIQYNGAGAATIDLRPATLQNGFGGGGYVSFVNGVHGGFTVAAGVMIENATGGSGSDTLHGNEGSNVLIGNNGEDTLNGNGGHDFLYGGDGFDILNGGEGNDMLEGGAGGDSLNGDGGDDIIFWDLSDASPTGGSGADVLVFTSGGPPTFFNLAGQGFEAAQGRFTVTGATYTDYYDAQWRLSEQRGQATSGATWYIDWDEASTLPYQRLNQDFNASGVLAREYGLADNGSTWNQYFDTDGSQPWVSLLQVHTAAGIYATEQGISDNGSTWNRFFDVDGTNPFVWVEQVRDSNGVLAQEEGLADTGTRWFTDFDETGLADFQYYQNVYDTLNRLSQQEGLYDNNHTWIIDYDETDAFAWYSIRRDYDENGVLISTIETPDGP